MKRRTKGRKRNKYGIHRRRMNGIARNDRTVTADGSEESEGHWVVVSSVSDAYSLKVRNSWLVRFT